MVPQTFTNYFLASAGASAALVGLLFVAVAVAPERVFGREATAERRALAGSSFIALLNALFVSLVALIPKANIGYAALTVALIGLINTLSLGRHFWEEWRMERGWPRVTLLAGSLGLYGYEIWIAVSMVGAPLDRGHVYQLAYLLLGAFSIGVGRAWELLGAQDEGLLTLLGLRRRRDIGANAPTRDNAFPAVSEPVGGDGLKGADRDRDA